MSHGENSATDRQVMSRIHVQLQAALLFITSLLVVVPVCGQQFSGKMVAAIEYQPSRQPITLGTSRGCSWSRWGNR